MGDVDVLMKELGSVKETIDAKMDAKIKPLGEEINRMGESVKSAMELQNQLRQQQAIQIMDDPRFMVRSGRFSGLSMADLGAAETALAGWAAGQAARGNTRAGGKHFEEITAARKSYSAGFQIEHASAWEEKAVRAFEAKTGAKLHPASHLRQSISRWADAIRKSYHVTKALDSTTAAAGDELVPTLEAAQLWMDVNLQTLVLPALRQVPMPSNPFDWPTQFGDVNWYPISENIQATTTDPATNKVTLTAYGLKTGVPFSDELNEDAVIALVPELNRSMARNAAEVIDDVLLNADTTVTNGINSDGATINTASAGKAHWLLGFNGLIHLPLVVNTAARADRNGAVTAADVYNRTLRLMRKYAAPQTRGDVVFFTDVNTAIASLAIDEVETVQNFGPRAAISSGELASIYNIPIIVSGQMRLADTDGSVTDSGNATNTGRVLGVNTTQWYVGFRRAITFENDREAGRGQTTMYASFRIALQGRSVTSATASNHTALVYDITGVV